MTELQATVEFATELCKFYNVDLFQRGLYQVRCGLRVPPKLPVQMEVSVPESVGKGLGTASVLGNGGACRTFQILYRNEEVNLQDIIIFRCHLLVDGRRLREGIERAEFSLVVELWFSEQALNPMVMVSTRTLQLNFSPITGLHYHLPVLFDYFHLSAVTVTVHATLVALHQPYIKKSILHYVQSCTPRSAKPWLSGSKFRVQAFNNTSLESVFQSSGKCGGGVGSGGGGASRLAQARLLHRHVCEVLLEAHHHLQAAYKDLAPLLPQWQRPREGTLGAPRERSVAQKLRKLCDAAKTEAEEDFTARANSDVAQLCAENIVQWQSFLGAVCGATAVHQQLARRHHLLRVRRLAEAFFLVENPRHSAAGCYDANYQSYLAVSEMARRSRYLALLPPLPVHCPALDGDHTTVPVIFEDQYQDAAEFARRRSAARKAAAAADPFRTAGSEECPATNATTPDPTDRPPSPLSPAKPEEDCSCGIAAILESRQPGVISARLVQSSVTLPARHSKSLDQLRVGSCATLPAGDAKRRAATMAPHNGCGGYFNSTLPVRHRAPPAQPRYTSRSAVDLALRSDPNMLFEGPHQPKSRCRGARRQYPHHVPHQHRSSDESERAAAAAAAAAAHVPRSNSTQIFPAERPDPAFRHSTLMLSRGREPAPIHNTRPPRPPYQHQPQMEHRDHRHNQHNHPHHPPHPSRRPPGRCEHAACPKNSSIRYKLGRDPQTSSSTDSESQTAAAIQAALASTAASANTKLHTSASVPHHLASRSVGDRLRHVRSASSVLDEQWPLTNAASESLPNLTGRKGATPSPSVSTSSLTSERSGWVSSRNSSELSSPEGASGNQLAINGEQLRSRLYELVRSEAPRMRVKNSCKTPTATPRPEHPYIRKEYPAPETGGYEELRLPPPKQFRDAPPPPEPFRDPSPGPAQLAPAPAIDNLLYHVYESIQDNVKHSRSRSTTNLADKIEDYLEAESQPQQSQSLQRRQPPRRHTPEHEQPERVLPIDECRKLFEAARAEFKSQLSGFSGSLYSELEGAAASTLPYFHISDEYRVFSPEGLHLVVCVHGLDGNSADLRLVKTYLELGLPGAHLDFLMSERNQGDTFSDFDTMTDRLVAEILYHVETCGQRPSRLSFVGHSLGNIIIRSALTRPQMRPLLGRLHTFLSLSGPHLGTLYNSSGLVNMGMWFMQKWKKSGSLLQLCLRDAPDVRHSFLYRLSQRSTLHHFRNVLLCGSSQDRYVPLHSARLELCKAAVRDVSSLGAAYREMVHNVLAPMLARRDLTLVRYDVHHALPHTANALIGRAAHIAVLDSELFIEKFLVVAGLKYFR